MHIVVKNISCIILHEIIFLYNFINIFDKYIKNTLLSTPLSVFFTTDFKTRVA